MGYMVGARCVAGLPEATDLYFSSIPESSQAGATAYRLFYEKVGGVWVFRQQSISSGVVSNVGSASATVPAFSDCDHTAQFFDGLQIGWGIAAAMITVYAVKFIAKGLHRDDY